MLAVTMPKYYSKILLGEDSLYRPVICDFDSTGLVKANYALPTPMLNIKKVTQRLYRGYCEHSTQVSEARQQILSMRKELLEILEAGTVLAIKSQKKWLSTSRNHWKSL